MATEVNRSLFARRKSEPKSVLGFYAIVLGILCAACVAICGALAWSGTAVGLIPWVLGFAALFLILLVAGVFVVMLRDPSKLMLTHVTGDQFLAIQSQHTLGDSLRGEHTISVLLSPRSPGAIEEVIEVDADVTTDSSSDDTQGARRD